MILDPNGDERVRLEGYLPRDEFHAFLASGLARLAFARKNWADAESRYNAIIENFPDSKFAPEAVYYRGVSRYSASHDSAELAAVAETFSTKYRDSIWALKAIPWAR